MYDILADSICNLHEFGNDTMKHRNKVLCKKNNSGTMEVVKHAHSYAPLRVMAGCHGISLYAWQHEQMVSDSLVDCWMGGGGLESIVLIHSNHVDCCLGCCLLYMKGLYCDVAKQDCWGSLWTYSDPHRQIKIKRKESGSKGEAMQWHSSNRNKCIICNFLLHLIKYLMLRLRWQTEAVW